MNVAGGLIYDPTIRDEWMYIEEYMSIVSHEPMFILCRFYSLSHILSRPSQHTEKISGMYYMGYTYSILFILLSFRLLYYRRARMAAIIGRHKYLYVAKYAHYYV